MKFFKVRLLTPGWVLKNVVFMGIELSSGNDYLPYSMEAFFFPIFSGIGSKKKKPGCIHLGKW